MNPLNRNKSKVHPNERKRIKEAIEDLAANPRPHGYIQLAGSKGECRMRIGEYRVDYEIEDDELVILVLRVGHCSDVYR